MAWLSSSKQQMSLCMSSAWETLSSRSQCYRVWLHEIRDWIQTLETTRATQQAVALAARAALRPFSMIVGLIFKTQPPPTLQCHHHVPW